MSEVIARYLIYSLLLYKWMVYDWNKRSYTLSDGKRNTNVIYTYVNNYFQLLHERFSLVRT